MQSLLDDVLPSQEVPGAPPRKGARTARDSALEGARFVEILSPHVRVVGKQLAIVLPVSEEEGKRYSLTIKKEREAVRHWAMEEYAERYPDTKEPLVKTFNAAIAKIERVTPTQESAEAATPQEHAKGPRPPQTEYECLFSTGYMHCPEGDAQAWMKSGELQTRVFLHSGRVDVLSQRRVFTVPDRLEQDAKASGTVHVTQLTNLSTGEKQVLEIHRSDTLATKPEFLSQIHAITPPHPKKRGELIHLMDVLGQVAPIEHRYDATGLIKASDGLRFLNPQGGALTAHGFDSLYRVQFNMQQESALERCHYGWARASSEEECTFDYDILRQIEGIAPGSSGYADVLLGTHGFTPFSQVCETGGVHSMIHGGTGSYKSATSRLILQAYSDVWGRNEISTAILAENKTSVYALEQIEYYLGGMFVHGDDALKGQGITDKDKKKFYELMSSRGRHAVTRVGGDKGTWNHGHGGIATAYYPRGSSIVTVEILPETESHDSDLARYAIVSLDGAECVNLPLLSELQEKMSAESMNRITASYIMWLLPRMDAYLNALASREEYYRAHGVHARIPTTYAKLETGRAAFLDFGVFIGALTQQEASQELAESRERLVQVALAQKALMGQDETRKRANDAVDLFYTLLRQALRQGRLYASDAAYRDVIEYNASGQSTQTLAKRPQPPLCLKDEPGDSWGWKFNESQRVYEPMSGASEVGVLKCEPGSPLSLHMYVKDFKDVIYPQIVKLGSSQDIPMPGLADILEKLKKRGKLKSTNPTNLHGRESRTGSCYILDMADTPDSEPTPHDEPTNSEPTPHDEEPTPEEPPMEVAPMSVEPPTPGKSPTPEESPKQWVTVYADINAGRALTDMGVSFTFPAKCTLSDFLTHAGQHTSVNRVFLCGERPGLSSEGFIAWLADGGMMVDYTTDKRGHYFDTLKPDSCVARYVHRYNHNKIDVRRINAWLGEERAKRGNDYEDIRYSLEDAHAALALVNRYLKQFFRPHSHISGTPSTTFKSLWTEGNRIAGKKFDVLPDDIRALIGHKGQGRIQFFEENTAKKLPGVYYYDGIFMYAGLTWGMPTELQTHDNINEYAGKLPARYRIRYTVPQDWQHVGLFMTPRSDGNGWMYPGKQEAGQTFETWVDGAELDVAYHLPQGMPAWDITILERIVFKSEKDSKETKPLTTITDKLVKIRAQMEKDARQDAEHARIYKLASGAIRNILLHGIGAFNSEHKTRTYILLDNEPAPDGFSRSHKNTYDHLDEKRRIYNIVEEHTDAVMAHPEWAALIWGRCRARMTRHALSQPYQNIVAIRTDAIATTAPVPSWENNTDIGKLRRKWAYPKPVQITSDEMFDKLQHKVTNK